MTGWRSRILLALIIYFGGFASAIYALAPGAKKSRSVETVAQSFDNEYELEAGTRSEAFAHAFNSVMHRCISFAEEKSVELSGLIRAKLSERQDSES